VITIIDNYDSFVANVARYVRVLGHDVRVLRNDAVSVEEVAAARPDAIILSPGPCGPDEAGVCVPLIHALSGRVPILGVCLGHQCIGAAFGAHVRRARRPMHGRASRITHDGTGLFAGLPSPLTVGRYHSLIVEDLAGTPIEATATSEDGEIMALAHRSHPTFGVQFHPESIMTEHGFDLFANFLAVGAGREPVRRPALQAVAAR
jgi:anthranilate synthase/aminodeoxychorismate synthase-like glutamine amidotransferase